MTDTQGPDATQADADAPSPADTHPDESQADQSISLNEAKKLRSEANSLRQRLRAAEAKAQAAEDAGKSDEEKRAHALKAAEERAADLERKLRATNARVAVTEAAAKANAISGRAVYALIREDLDYDDDGEPTNVAALIAQAKRSDPELFRAAAGDGDGGKRGPSGNAINVNDVFRQLAENAH